MIGDAELVTGDPRWHNFLPGISPLGLIFTGVEASGELSWDVVSSPFGIAGNCYKLPSVCMCRSLGFSVLVRRKPHKSRRCNVHPKLLHSSS